MQAGRQFLQQEQEHTATTAGFAALLPSSVSLFTDCVLVQLCSAPSVICYMHMVVRTSQHTCWVACGKGLFRVLTSTLHCVVVGKAEAVEAGLKWAPLCLICYHQGAALAGWFAAAWRCCGS